MRVLVTGGAGLLGSALLADPAPAVELHATQRSTPVQGAEAHTVDLCGPAAVADLVARLRPEVVIHTAYGKGDGRREIVEMTRNVAEACRRAGAWLIHVSTDRVFDGERAPYAESDPVRPIEPYGEWKARAEQVVSEVVPDAAIVRTSLIVGPAERDLVVRKLLAGSLEPQFVDEIRCPIAVEDLTAQIWEVATRGREHAAGIWHLVGPEALSRFALAVLLARRHGADAAGIQPALNRSFPQRRPADLRLLTARADRELRTLARPISEVLFPPT